MNILKHIEKWFETAKPNPTEKDKATQIGAHFEEVSEMMFALSCNPVQVYQISQEFYVSDAINKDIDGSVVVFPEGWQSNLLDSLCDQIVTAIGVGYIMGFDMEGALSEVNASNWSKFQDGKPVFNENGKIAKGKDYFKPELAKYIKRGKSE